MSGPAQPGGIRYVRSSLHLSGNKSAPPAPLFKGRPHRTKSAPAWGREATEMPEALQGDIAATKAKLNLDDFWLTSFGGVATTHLQACMAKEVSHSAEEHSFGAFLE